MKYDLISRLDRVLNDALVSAPNAALLRDCREALVEWERLNEQMELVSLSQIVAERDSLRAQLAEAQKDVERLDWMEANWRDALATFDERIPMIADGMTLRAAIDAARTQPGSGEEGT